MKPIYFNGKTYISAKEWCEALIWEIRLHDIDVESIELYPLHKNIDTEAILSEMTTRDLKEIVLDILNFYKS